MPPSWIRWTLVLAVAGTPCLAEYRNALDPPDPARYLRWGALRVRPGLEVRNLGRDDNIFADDQNKVADTTITLVPRLDGLMLFGDRAFLTFRADLEYTAYQENSDQNFLNRRLGGRATLPLRKMGFYVDGQTNFILERPIDAQDVRVERDENGYGLGLILEPAWRTEIELGGETMRKRYEDPDDPTNDVAERLDRNENRLLARVRYMLVGRTRLTLDTWLRDYDFKGSIGAARDTVEWSALPGVQFGEGGRLSGSLRAGWTVLEPEDPTEESFSGVSGRAAVSYRPGHRTTFTLSGRREPEVALTGESTFLLRTMGGLRGVYYFNRIFGFDVGGSRGTLKFPDTAATFEREDRIFSYDAALRFRLSESQIGRRVEYSLRYRHWRVDSNVPTANQTRNQFGFGAVLGF